MFVFRQMPCIFEISPYKDRDFLSFNVQISDKISNKNMNLKTQIINDFAIAC